MKAFIVLIASFLFNISAQAELSYGNFSQVSSPQQTAACEEKSVQSQLNSLIGWLNVPGQCGMADAAVQDLQQIQSFLTLNYRSCTPSDRQVLDKALSDISIEMQVLQNCPSLKLARRLK